jgi:hypothetical protein
MYDSTVVSPSHYVNTNDTPKAGIARAMGKAKQVICVWSRSSVVGFSTCKRASKYVCSSLVCLLSVSP